MFIYAITSLAEPGVKYVGSTTVTLPARLRQHMYNATRGAETPLAQWIRQQALGTIQITELQKLGVNASNRELLAAETAWLRFIRESGRVLLTRGLPLKTRVDTGLPPVPLAPPCELPKGFVL